MIITLPRTFSIKQLFILPTQTPCWKAVVTEVNNIQCAILYSPTKWESLSKIQKEIN
jgi:hypothetical protein